MVVVEKWRLLFLGPESFFSRDDYVYLTDPSHPHRMLTRRVAALSNDYVQLANGPFIYQAKVEEGYCFLVDDKGEGEVSH